MYNPLSMHGKEQIIQRIAELEDSFAHVVKDKNLDPEEVWNGEEYGVRFELNRMEGEAYIFLTIQGRSLKGKRQLLADFMAVLGEPTLPGDGLPKQHLFTWSRDEGLLKFSELLKEAQKTPSLSEE